MNEDLFKKIEEAAEDFECDEIEQFVQDQKLRQSVAYLQRLDEPRPQSRIKDYVMAFALGLGIGAGLTLYWSKKLEINVNISEPKKSGYVRYER